MKLYYFLLKRADGIMYMKHKCPDKNGKTQTFNCFTDTIFRYLKTSTEFFTFHPDVWCHGNPDVIFKLVS